MKNSIVAEVLRIAMEYERYLQTSGKDDSLTTFSHGFGHEFNNSAEMYAIVSSVRSCAIYYARILVTQE